MNILLIAIGYFPFPLASDKNFFYNLVPLIKKKVKNVVILSLNDEKSPLSIQKINHLEVPIYNLKRSFHFQHGERNRFLRKTGNLYYYHHWHNPLQEMIEKYITFFGAIRKIEDLITEYDINLIHIMDNIGLSIDLIKRNFTSIPITCSFMVYWAKGWLYEQYIKLIYRKVDNIVCYNEEMKKQFIKLKIPKEKLAIIRWGIKERNVKLSLQQKKDIKLKFNCSPNSKLVLWTGFIQQIQERDFYKTVNCMKKIIVKERGVEVIFAFKPESYKKEYSKFKSEKLKILTNIDNFSVLLETADILLAPISNLDSIVAPPLTWLEAMGLGTPVITTDARGVHEVIIDNVTGYIADNYENLIKKIRYVMYDNNLDIISNNATDFVKQRYSIEKSAEEYLKLWERICQK